MNRYFKLLTILALCTSANTLFPADSERVTPDKDQKRIELLPLCLKSHLTWPTYTQVLKIADTVWEKEKIKMTGVREEFKALSKEAKDKLVLKAHNDLLQSGFPKCIQDASGMKKAVDHKTGVENAHGCIDSYIKAYTSLLYLQQQPPLIGEKFCKGIAKWSAAWIVYLISESEKRS